MASRTADKQAPSRAKSLSIVPRTTRPRLTDANGPRLISAYLREVASVSILKPDEEQNLANSIAEARAKYWTALLNYPALADSIIELFAHKLRSEVTHDNFPDEELEQFRTSCLAMPHCTMLNSTADEKQQQAQIQVQLARCIANLDLDGVVSELVMADLYRIKEGLDPKHLVLDLRMVPSTEGDAHYEKYFKQARATLDGLNHLRNQFVRANLRLVISIARRFDHGLMPLQDLIQEGNIGLMKSVDRFDPRLGFRFSTYASWWIRHAINRALANKGRTVRLPAHVSADLQRIGRARREIETKTGAKATVSQLAKHTTLSVQRVQKLMRLALEPTVSLDAPIGGEDQRGLADLLVDLDSPMPGDQLEIDGINEHLIDALTHLAPIEIDILCKRYGINADDEFEPMTLRQLGELHSLSRERIRQLQERALHKLRIEFHRRDLMVA